MIVNYKKEELTVKQMTFWLILDPT